MQLSEVLVILFDIETWNYSMKPGSSDVRKIIRSAVNDFPDLSDRIGKLYVFIFNSKQIKEGIDIEKLCSHIDLSRRKPLKGWDMMRSDWTNDIASIEVRIEEFMSSSETRRKFVARHELGHIFLSGPSACVVLKDILIDNNVKNIVDREVERIVTIWQEYKVDSLMVRMFPKLTMQYIAENPAGYSQTKDQQILNRCQTPFERLLVAIRLMIIYKSWLTILEKAPSSLRNRVGESIRSQHSKSVELLKRQALQMRPELRDVDTWFTKECLESAQSLIKRVLELTLDS